jgi:hypothetical protein
VVVAPVKVPFVAKRLVVLMLVLVLLVMVALVPVSDVKNPLVAVRIDAKKLVLVAAVVVLRRMFAKMFAPEKVLASERSVDDAAVLPMQTPRMLKQPLVSWMPLAKVEVALPVTAKLVVVALVVVERSPVKFWRVVEPLARIVCAESAPMEPDCAERPTVCSRFIGRCSVMNKRRSSLSERAPCLSRESRT